ncbi:uncharacterized protein RCO7_09887 [Rhynchosporium graminicola]|uniref:Uncharacterized protein n=1 Tax=Rhynchosporium graminicola TaxID=2792576 RepID=A0A1E1LEW9_9HELO|nr:uncharacterized protein RCO7_09887 [Rhynchosporium commune]
MRSSKSYTLVVLNLIVLLFTSLTTIALAAPTVSPITDFITRSATMIFNATTVLDNSSQNLNARDDLTIAVQQGDPDNGETIRPEPKVSFLTCKPRKDTRYMCSLAGIQKSDTKEVSIIIYDHNCYRVGGSWKADRGPASLAYTNNGDKHGVDLFSSALIWNVLLYMEEEWAPYSWLNKEMRIQYGSYDNFPFQGRSGDYPAKWRDMQRSQSKLFKDTYYDFFRVPFSCPGEFS